MNRSRAALFAVASSIAAAVVIFGTATMLGQAEDQPTDQEVLEETSEPANTGPSLLTIDTTGAYEAALADIEGQRSAALARAAAEVAAQRETLQRQAATEVDAQRRAAQEALARELEARRAATTSAATAAPAVQHASGGDRDAFEFVYRHRVREIARYVQAIVRDPAVRDDVVAETFLQAWRDLPRLRQPERFDAWLLRIAHNRAISEVSRRSVRTFASFGDSPPDPPDQDRFGRPGARLEALTDARIVREALLDLPRMQREAITLRYLRGLSYDEVAQQLGKSNDAVRQICHRALHVLRRALGDEF